MSSRKKSGTIGSSVAVARQGKSVLDVVTGWTTVKVQDGFLGTVSASNSILREDSFYIRREDGSKFLREA